MKKMNYLIMLTIVLSIVFFGCKKDSTETEPKTDPNEQTLVVVANFYVNRPFVEVGEVITFTNTSAEGVRYEWTFGNGTSSTLMSPTVVYNTKGTYTVKLTAFDKNNKSSIKSSTITVGERYLTQIKVNKLTWLNSTGTIWDGGLLGDNSGPDLMFMFGQNLENKTTTISNVIESQLTAGSVVWNLGGTIKLTNAIWNFKLYDVDSSVNDLMATWSFNPMTTGNKSYTTGAGSFTLGGSSTSTYEIVFSFQIKP